MKTIAVVGAGPLTGLAIARRFGREGFRAALIARRQESLDAMVAMLASEGIKGQGFIADVTDEMALSHAFAAIRAAFGTIDALSYSPMGMTMAKPSEITAEIARDRFEFLVIGAINSVKQVLPDMLARKHGSILLANGRSAILPMPMIGSMTLGCTALRGYAYALHQEIVPQGVGVGMVTISKGIDETHAVQIAELFWQLHINPREIEKVYGDDIGEMQQIVDLMGEKLAD
ncbi:MAG TPA: SDR family NAD(P)-dependent oxidoreductase [Novosphingobium sp.]